MESDKDATVQVNTCISSGSNYQVYSDMILGKLEKEKSAKDQPYMNSFLQKIKSCALIRDKATPKFFALYLLAQALEAKNIPLAKLFLKETDFLSKLTSPLVLDADQPIEEKGKTVFYPKNTNVGINCLRLIMEIFKFCSETYASERELGNFKILYDGLVKAKVNGLPTSYVYLNKRYEVSVDFEKILYNELSKKNLESPNKPAVSPEKKPGTSPPENAVLNQILPALSSGLSFKNESPKLIQAITKDAAKHKLFLDGVNEILTSNSYSPTSKFYALLLVVKITEKKDEAFMQQLGGHVIMFKLQGDGAVDKGKTRQERGRKIFTDPKYSQNDVVGSNYQTLVVEAIQFWGKNIKPSSKKPALGKFSELYTALKDSMKVEFPAQNVFVGVSSLKYEDDGKNKSLSKRDLYPSANKPSNQKNQEEEKKVNNPLYAMGKVAAGTGADINKLKQELNHLEDSKKELRDLLKNNDEIGDMGDFLDYMNENLQITFKKSVEPYLEPLLFSTDSESEKYVNIIFLEKEKVENLQLQYESLKKNKQKYQQYKNNALPLLQDQETASKTPQQETTKGKEDNKALVNSNQSSPQKKEVNQVPEKQDVKAAKQKPDVPDILRGFGQEALKPEEKTVKEVKLIKGTEEVKPQKDVEEAKGSGLKPALAQSKDNKAPLDNSIPKTKDSQNTQDMRKSPEPIVGLAQNMQKAQEPQKSQDPLAALAQNMQKTQEAQKSQEPRVGLAQSTQKTQEAQNQKPQDIGTNVQKSQELRKSQDPLVGLTQNMQKAQESQKSQDPLAALAQNMHKTQEPQNQKLQDTATNAQKIQEPRKLQEPLAGQNMQKTQEQQNQKPQDLAALAQSLQKSPNAQKGQDPLSALAQDSQKGQAQNGQKPQDPVVAFAQDSKKGQTSNSMSPQKGKEPAAGLAISLKASDPRDNEGEKSSKNIGIAQTRSIMITSPDRTMGQQYDDMGKSIKVSKVKSNDLSDIEHSIRHSYKNAGKKVPDFKPLAEIQVKEEFEKEISKLKAEKEALQKENLKLNNQVKLDNHDKEAAKQDRIEAEQLKGLLNENQQHTKALENVIAELAEENSNLKNQIIGLQKRQNDEKARPLLEEKVKKLEDEIGNISAKAKKQDAQAQAENNQLKTQVKDLQKENGDLKKVNNDLQKENMDLKKKNNELFRGNQQVVEENQGLQHENQALQQENQAIIEEIRELQHENQDLQNENLALAKKVKQLETKKVGTSPQKEQGLQRENQELQEENQALQQENKALVEEISELKDEKQDLQNDKLALAKKVRQLEAKNKNVGLEHQQEDEELLQENQELQQEVRGLQQKNRDLQKENQALGKRVKQLEDENADLGQHIQKLKDHLNYLNEQQQQQQPRYEQPIEGKPQPQPEEHDLNGPNVPEEEHDIPEERPEEPAKIQEYLDDDMESQIHFKDETPHNQKQREEEEEEQEEEQPENPDNAYLLEDDDDDTERFGTPLNNSGAVDSTKNQEEDHANDYHKFISGTPVGNEHPLYTELKSSIRGPPESNDLKSFKLACLKNKSPIFENAMIRVGISSTPVQDHVNHKNMLKLVLYFENKSKEPIERFQTSFNIPHGLNRVAKPGQLDTPIEQGKQVKQQLIVAFDKIPYENLELNATIISAQGKESKFSLFLPTIITKFMEFKYIDSDMFRKRWKLKTKKVFKTEEITVEPSVIKTIHDFKNYFANLLDLKPTDEEEFAQGRKNIKLGGMFDLDLPNTEYLMKIHLLPGNRAVFQIACFESESKTASFLLQALVFLFQKA